MKFPVTIRHDSAKAKIYGRRKNYAYYRLAYAGAGKRRLQAFVTYSKALAAAKKITREIHEGSQTAALSPSQSRDALAAYQRLQAFYVSTGRRVSLLTSVSEYVEAVSKLKAHTLDAAITGFLSTVADVKRKHVKLAVEEFLKADAPRTKANKGQQAQLSAKYAYNRGIQLNKFADTFPAIALCDLTKEHLDKFIGSLEDFSAKSRNHYRAAIRQVLQWAVRKDYPSPTHRLNEADSMRSEHSNTPEAEFYTPGEFAALLEHADDTLRPIIALGGLAGLRTAELMRLDWSDVWRVPGHIEITIRKSKTRQRRLVEICPALAQWLELDQAKKAGKLWNFHEVTFHEKFGGVCKTAEVKRKDNGLRHAFCTYHFAAHADENKTAQQAGNSPTMIHRHYKGLATKTEGEKWFNVTPPTAANNVIHLKAAAND